MAVVLTADICAHGVIASARYFGFDPIKAVLAQRGRPRAAVTAAALAAERLTGARRDTISRIFSIQPTSLARLDREGARAVERAVAAASEAMITAGLDLSGGGLIGEPPVVRMPPWQLNRVAGPTKAPVPDMPPAPRVDHTDAIRTALAKMKTAPKFEGVKVVVVGVEADKALIPAAAPHTCHWPLGDLLEGTLRSCGAEAVSGRMYCPKHCKAAGQKPTPKQIEIVGRVAAPYRDPRADNASGRKAAS